MIGYSRFRSSLSRDPEQAFCEWTEFVERLHTMSLVEREASADVKRWRTPAISPAIYEGEQRRANAHVTAWGAWLGLDFDGGIEAETVLHSVDGLNYVLYSSTGCTAGRHKFRLILQLDRAVEREETLAVWTGAQSVFDATVDGACKDPSRLYYVPSLWTPGDLNPAPIRLFEATTNGAVLPVEDLISAIPAGVMVPTLAAPVPLVEQVQGRALEEPSRLLTRGILERYLSTPKGQHHTALFSLMVACAFEAMRKGLAVDAGDLVCCVREADQASLVKTAVTRWQTISTEAARALSHAKATHDAAGGGTDILGLGRSRRRANRNLQHFAGGKGR